MYFLLEPNDLPNIMTPLKNRTSQKCFEFYQCNYWVHAALHILKAHGKVAEEGRVFTFTPGQYLITKAQFIYQGWTFLKCTGFPTTMGVCHGHDPPHHSFLAFIMSSVDLLLLSYSPFIYLFFPRGFWVIFSFPADRKVLLNVSLHIPQRREVGR